MDDEINIVRLADALDGTGCEVSRARVAWALNSSLTDEHIIRLAGWAALEFLMADYTALTDRSNPVLSDFPITDLSLGETAITADAFLGASWPRLHVLGIAGIDFSGQLIVRYSRVRTLLLLMPMAPGCHGRQCVNLRSLQAWRFLKQPLSK